ncbi:MAG TPA: hypothetical protein VI341_12110 [Actinomycetota bacterium]
MNGSTDPLTRQMALSALTTEQFNLQSARIGTIAEANGRSSLYLGTLSSATIAIAFIGQAHDLGDTFYLFALILLPSVFLLGVFTYLRLVQTSIEDYVFSLVSLRIREYFVEIDPAVTPFFPPTDVEGMKKLMRMGMVSTSPLQAFLTTASMVASINAIVGGVAVALAVRSLLDASAVTSAWVGVLFGLVFEACFLLIGSRRFLKAVAVVPELYPWHESGAVVWSARIQEKNR